MGASTRSRVVIQLTGQPADRPLGEFETVDHVRSYGDEAELAVIVGCELFEVLEAGGDVVVFADRCYQEAIVAVLDRIDPRRTRRNGTLATYGPAETRALHVAACLESYGRVEGGKLSAGVCNGSDPLFVCAERVLAPVEPTSNTAVDPEANRLVVGDDAFRVICVHRRAVVPPGPDGSAFVRDKPARPAAGDDGSADVAIVELAPAKDAPYEARHFVVRALESWSYRGDLLDEAALITSELSANAVVHARTPFSVTLTRSAVHGVPPTLRISVVDGAGDSGQPRVRRGHGLGLVSSLSRQWGIERSGVAKTIWAELK